MEVEEAASRLTKLFSGSELGYGQYAAVDDKSGKIRGSAMTVAGEGASEKQWIRHLKGVPGSHLGIAPSRLDLTCTFSAIDVDYAVGVPVTELLRRKWDNPDRCTLIPIVSKGGGLHLFSFMKPTSVTVASARMVCDVHDLRLDMSKVDLFPRSIRIETRDVWLLHVGTWILMPFFGEFEENPLFVEGFIMRAELMVERSA